MGWFRWGEWRSETNLYRTRMHDFVRDMIQFEKIVTMLCPDRAWWWNAFFMEKSSNYDMSGGDWSSKQL